MATPHMVVCLWRQSWAWASLSAASHRGNGPILRLTRHQAARRVIARKSDSIIIDRMNDANGKVHSFTFWTARVESGSPTRIRTPSAEGRLTACLMASSSEVSGTPGLPFLSSRHVLFSWLHFVWDVFHCRPGPTGRENSSSALHRLDDALPVLQDSGWNRCKDGLRGSGGRKRRTMGCPS